MRGNLLPITSKGRPRADPDLTLFGPASRVMQRPGQWSVSLQECRPGQVSGQRKYALTRPDPAPKDTNPDKNDWIPTAYDVFS